MYAINVSCIIGYGKAFISRKKQAEQLKLGRIAFQIAESRETINGRPTWLRFVGTSPETYRESVF
jgi:hypothetical protein